MKENNLKNVYLFSLFFIYSLIILFSYIKNNDSIKYKNYINSCKFLKRYNITKILGNINEPFLSICLPLYNMEKYIKRALLSIINQSFQDFEIILVDDNSNDNTQIIIKNFQREDNRIKIIYHYKNLGVYSSRLDAIFNAKGKYILLMDPDDMILNPELFKDLFNYNIKYNLDIIEFTVYHQEERKKTIYFQKNHCLRHYHGFKKNIIYQPELSNILFYEPNSKNYTSVICRTIWNKLIRKNVLLNTINYIEKEFHNKFLITADDTPISIIALNYAKNYSNINTPGYLYNVRKKSMSRGNNGKNHDIIVSINYLLYYKLFYKYIKEFDKDINYLLYDFKIFSFYLLKIKDFNVIEYIPIAIKLFKNIINNNKISKDFKNDVCWFLNYFLK